MPFTIDFLNDGQVLEWEVTADSAVATERNDYTPRFYVANVTHDHADGWMRKLAQADYSSTHKSNCQKSIQMLFKWIAHEREGSEWDPDITFTDSDASSPRDYLTREE